MWIILLFISIFYQHLLVEIPSCNAQNTERSSVQSDCIKYPNATNVAHIGWPFVPTCYQILDRFRDFNDSLYLPNRKKNSTCKLFYSNGTLVGAITDTPQTLKRNIVKYYFDKFPSFPVQDGRNENFIFEFAMPSANFCAIMNMYLKPKTDPTSDKKCENIQDEVINLSKSIIAETSERLSCKAVRDPELYFPLEDATFEWWYNCNKSLPKNTIQQGNELIISSTDFSNPGEYLCAVMYGGNRRFISRHKLCVEFADNVTYSIKCQDVKGKLGGNVDVICFVNTGSGYDGYKGQFNYIKWFNGTNGNETDICNARSKSIREQFFGTVPDTRITCDILWKNRTDLCYDNAMSSNEVTPSFQTFRIKLQIKNLQTWDVGQYHMLFRTFNNDFQNASATVSISTDGEQNRTVLIIAVTVSILVVLIFILLIVCLWKKLLILWLCKKCCGAYEKVNKPYVAYLVYYYSSGMNERSRNLTEDLVSSLHEFMKSIGSKTYNDHKDKNELQLDAENISMIQKDCHRIIIILNDEYVTEQWYLLKEYLANQNKSGEKAKLIFIQLPGVKKHLKQLPNEQQKALVHAMKSCSTIKWDGKHPLSLTFRHHLQYFLPKLKENSIPVEPVANRLIQEEMI